MEQIHQALIIAVHKERYHLMSEEHGMLFARLKSSNYYQNSIENFPTTGDRVEYLLNPMGDSQILHTLPRKSHLYRFDLHSWTHAQAIAANFDTIFILTSANRDMNPRRLHRYLASARSSGADYAIILTKVDLADRVEEYLKLAREAAGDCPVFPISSLTGEGLDAIRAYMKPHSVTIFLGSSGVGKSTLVNTLAGEEIMDVNGIREDDSKGRHTTTHRQMITLKNGAMILDTPGMREFGLVDAQEGVGQTFEEIAALERQCRFRNCTHRHEPGCAILQAMEEGKLSKRRLEEYQALKNEAKRMNNREHATEMQQRAARQKAISKYARQIKKGKKIDESNF